MKRHFISPALTACAAAGVLVLTGCTTTESRIAERPAVYNQLRPSDQTLVSQGRIRPGLSQDAVYIAWGAPTYRGSGDGGGRAVETWIYTSSTSGDYYPPSFGYDGYYGRGFGYGFGYGGGGYRRGYGRFRYGGHYPFYDPFYYRGSQIIYYPERTVTFRNGRVMAFQYLPEPRIY